MEREELEGLANYCAKHDCFKCELDKECYELEVKIIIAGLINTVSNIPEYWGKEDIDYILAKIN